MLIISGFICGIVSMLLPAAGAYVHFSPPASLLQHIVPGTDAAYMDDFFAIRDGSLRQLQIAHAKGLATFPSFHTMMSLMMIYALRGTGWAAIVGLVFNLGIIATTLIDGGHYLIDLFGAVVATALTIVIVKALARWLHNRRPMRLPASINGKRARIGGPAASLTELR